MRPWRPVSCDGSMESGEGGKQEVRNGLFSTSAARTATTPPAAPTDTPRTATQAGTTAAGQGRCAPSLARGAS